jgi:hypothetical protein
VEVTYTLAYYGTEINTAVKIITVYTPGLAIKSYALLKRLSKEERSSLFVMSVSDERKQCFLTF